MSGWQPRPGSIPDRILQALADGPKTDGELASLLSIQHAAANMAARRLADEGYLTRTSERPLRNVLQGQPLPKAPPPAPIQDDPWTAWVAMHLAALAELRPVFHSEKDFQVALAMQLARSDGVDPRLEVRPRPDENAYLDLLVRHDGREVGMELKYVSSALDVTVSGEPFVLREHSAEDHRRYDVVKDLVRVEGWVADGLLERGFVVALTNNRRLYRPGRAGCIDADFRIHEGAVLEGVRRWASHAGAGTIEKRQDDLVVRGRHVCRWRPYATVESADFRVLILPVPGVEPR